MKFKLPRIIGLPSIARKLKLDPASEIAGKLRASQIRTMMSTTPLMMVVITAIALIMATFLHGRPGTDFLNFWVATVCAVALFGFANSRASNQRERVVTASPNGPKKAVRGVLVLGALWGIVPALLYPVADFPTKITIVAIMGGILGGGAMSLYVIPRALFAFLGAVAIGASIGLARSGEVLDFAIIALLGCYTIALMRAGWTLATTFAESVVSTIKLKENSETIGVLLKEFSESASDWLWEVDQTGKFTMGMHNFSKHLGADIQAVCPIAKLDFSTDQTIDDSMIKGFNNIWENFQKGENFRDIVLSTSDENGQRWVSVSGKPIFDVENNFAGFRGVASNITETKLAEERIAYLAHNDALTGLVNRPHFSQSINRQLKSRRNENIWSVMFLDLDGFKLVNDSKGHAVGDALLVEVAARLKKNLGAHDIVARFGGDEFAVLCTSANTIETTADVAERVLNAVSTPYHLENGTVVAGIGVSIGIAIGQKDGKSERELLHNADLALYRSKSEGKGTYRFFEVEMDEVVKERRSLELDLSEALLLNQLSVSFQPLVSAENKRTEGFEALLRWNHPTRGLISPVDFIPLAESMGIISDIGDWVLQEACAQAARWPSHLTVAVNLSPQQFLNNRIVNSVTRAITKTGLDPRRLELEITEGLFIDNTDEVTFVLRELKSMGVSIALDDFGTGYSSLSYLLKFPFDKLKIDRSFISSIDEDLVARNVLEAIAKLGNVLDLKVTAEGVETLDQVEALKNLECTHFQGYLFGKPLASTDMAAFLMKEVAETLPAQQAESSSVADITAKNVSKK